MKRDIIVHTHDGPAAGQIHAEGDRLRYQRDGVPPVSASFEAQPIEPGSYWVRVGRRSYRVTTGAVVGGVREVSVNGRTLRLEVFDPRNLRAAGRGSSSHGRQEVSAPMPGKVVRVLVEVGVTVEEGQGVVVVEAMKMQNEMKSPKSGVVVEVRTRADATVAAGEVLVVVE